MIAPAINYCSAFCLTGKQNLSDKFTDTISRETSDLCCLEITLPCLSKISAKRWEKQRVYFLNKNFCSCFQEGVILRICHITSCTLNSVCCLLSPLGCAVSIMGACGSMIRSIYDLTWMAGHQACGNEVIAKDLRESSNLWQGTAKTCCFSTLVIPILMFTTFLDILKCPLKVACSEICYAEFGEAETNLLINQCHNKVGLSCIP